MAIGVFGLSISDFVAIIALGVSITALGVTAITFYIGHTRSKKSEQIRISREIWYPIDVQEEIFEKITMEDLTSSSDNRMRMVKAMDSLTNEIDYFVYLMEKGEIKDSAVREYYRKRLDNIDRTAKFINRKYPDSKEYSGTQKILDLLKNTVK